MTRRLELTLAVLAVLALVTAGCGSDSDSDGAAATATTTAAADGSTTTAADEAPAENDDLNGEITVSAAASLNKAFDELAKDFQEDHPDAKVVATYDSSTALSGQILDGAPVDLFASADEANMTKLTDEDLVDGDPVVFARNELVIVTKPGNPEGITSLADLTDAGVLSLCAADAPCGKFAAQALDAAGVTVDEGGVTRGQNATATLTAVTEGDAVAGVVYVTDARSAGDAVDTVAIPAAVNAVATYPIGVLSAAGNPDVAQAFLDYVLSDEGQMVLKGFGFLPPT